MSDALDTRRDPYEPLALAVSTAVHAAGLALRLVTEDVEDERLIETLPTYYGHPSLAWPPAAADVAGLIEARRRTGIAQPAGPEKMSIQRIALAAMDAALLVLGIDPDGERERVAPVIGNIERFGRDTPDYEGGRSDRCPYEYQASPPR